MRILGLDRNDLPSLSSRRELATIREIRRIQAEVNSSSCEPASCEPGSGSVPV